MRGYFGNILVAAVCISGFFVSGCTSSSDSFNMSSDLAASSTNGAGDLRFVNVLPSQANTNNGTDVLVSENDLLEIDVFQVDELDKEVRVDPSGKISLALIGSVDAAGKTISQLEADIERLYSAKYLQNPEVSVFMKESAGQRVTVVGAFAKPGRYATDSNTTLLQILALSGGLTELADSKKLHVSRTVGDVTYVAIKSVKDIREGKEVDPPISGGDTVVAFKSGAKIAGRNLREALGIATSITKLASPI